MRALAYLAPVFLLCGACGQKVDHSDPAPACDPAVMKCFYGAPATSSGNHPVGNAAGATSTDEEVATLTGDVVVLGQDTFDPGVVLTSMAQVSATGGNGARVMTDYDGKPFQLEGALKAAANWFLVSPASASGMVPTIMPVDTRATTAISVGVIDSVVLDTIFLNLNTERSTERAQVVLRVVDSQDRSVVGVHASASPEVLAYRTAGVWLRDNSGTELATDDSGMILLGNLQAGSALAPLSIALSGAASARIDVLIEAGATTLVTAVVAKK